MCRGSSATKCHAQIGHYHNQKQQRKAIQSRLEHVAFNVSPSASSKTRIIPFTTPKYINNIQNISQYRSNNRQLSTSCNKFSSHYIISPYGGINFKSPFKSPFSSSPFRLSSPSSPFYGNHNNNHINNNGNHNSNNTNDFDNGLFASSPELEQLAMKSTDAPVLLRVVTYNVLSSSLAEPSHFTSCSPSNLDSTTRLKRLLAKLEVPVASRSIICLQEVSLSWSGHLHTFFANRGFHFLLASHGSYFNGYMGEGLAFPLDLFEAVDMKIERLTDTVSWPVNKQQQSYQNKNTIIDKIQKIWKIIMSPSYNNKNGSTNNFKNRSKVKREPWDHAKGRYNRFIFVRLRSRTNGSKFCIGTYHMPCIYWSPSVMLIHAGLVVRNFQKLCGNDHGILTGDFNIQPNGVAYDMITSGKIDMKHPDFPPKCPDGSPPENWFPTPLAPMKSAYKEILGSEPEFTNFAKTGNDPAFIETLDYIFCTENVDVVDVINLPKKANVESESLPNDSEPSDHIMIGATVRVNAPDRRIKDKNNRDNTRGRASSSYLYQSAPQGSEQ